MRKQRKCPTRNEDFPPPVVGVLFMIMACSKNDGPPPNQMDTVERAILFSSGFEADTYLTDEQNNYQFIRGTDAETGFTWPISILGSNFSGIHRINDDDGPAISNALVETVGPKGISTTALYQGVNYDVDVTQTPYQINSINQNPDTLHISYAMKIDDVSLLGADKWRAIWEYKTKNYNDGNGDGFRMIAFIATDKNGDPFWMLQGDRSPSDPIWQVRNKQVPVPREEWFQVSYDLIWSAGTDGYAAMYINNERIVEHRGATTYNNDDLDFIILTQVYGNTHPMYQWIDDIEIRNFLEP